MKLFSIGRIILVVFIFLLLAILSYGILKYSNAQSDDNLEENVVASSMQLSNNSDHFFNKTTHVNITKIVDGSNGYPEFTYKIDIPDVDDFEFILAMDSSGSLLDGNQEKAVRGAVPRFIKKINESYKDKNFNLSIISWDEDLDFIYPAQGNINPFGDNRTSIAAFANVPRVDSDLARYNPFASTDPKLYYTKEEEFTDLNIPLEASLDLFNRTPINEFNRTSRFLILVTGRGEFKPADLDLIEKFNKSNISIYVIGMDLFEFNNNLTRNLKIMTRNDSQKYQVMSSDPTERILEDRLLDALETALRNAINESVAKNVTIVESFYDYVTPNKDNIYIIERYFQDSKIMEINPKYKYYNISGNDSRIRTITIELMDELKPDSQTIVKYSADLTMKKFPLVFSANSIDFFNKIADINSVPNSHFSYVWLKKIPVNDSLPDIPIDISILS